MFYICSKQREAGRRLNLRKQWANRQMGKRGDDDLQIDNNHNAENREVEAEEEEEEEEDPSLKFFPILKLFENPLQPLPTP